MIGIALLPLTTVAAAVVERGRWREEVGIVGEDKHKEAVGMHCCIPLRFEKKDTDDHILRAILLYCILHTPPAIQIIPVLGIRATIKKREIKFRIVCSNVLLFFFSFDEY